MKKAVLSSGNVAAGIFLGLIVFAFGVLLFVFFPFTLIGWVLGPIYFFLAFFMGGKRYKVWRCTNCRSIVSRG